MAQMPSILVSSSAEWMFEVPLNRPQTKTSCPSNLEGSRKIAVCCSAAGVTQPLVMVMAKSPGISLLVRMRQKCHNFADSAMGSIAERQLLADGRLKPPLQFSLPRTGLPRRRPGIRGSAAFPPLPRGPKRSGVPGQAREGGVSGEVSYTPARRYNAHSSFPLSCPACEAVCHPRARNKAPSPCPSA